MKVLDFGKNKGKALEKCEESYILWLSRHEKVLALRNRWACNLAQQLLQKEKMMQTLKGSEKQIKWASDIRDEAVNWAEENVKILENQGLPAPYAQEIRRLISQAIDARASAEYWIENRKVQMACPAQYQQNITDSLKKEIPPLRESIDADRKYSIVWGIRGLKGA